MAKLVTGILVVVALAAIVPFGLIALARSKPSPTPPMHPIMDMVKQPKFRAQRENPMFCRHARDASPHSRRRSP